jgi:hypothetical protein
VHLEDNINISFKEINFEYVGCVNLFTIRVRWWAILYVIINNSISSNIEISLIKLAVLLFSEMYLLLVTNYN